MQVFAKFKNKGATLNVTDRENSKEPFPNCTCVKYRDFIDTSSQERLLSNDKESVIFIKTSSLPEITLSLTRHSTHYRQYSHYHIFNFHFDNELPMRQLCRFSNNKNGTRRQQTNLSHRLKEQLSCGE